MAMNARRFDHLISLEQHCRRDGEPERLRRLQIDDQLELCRLLDRKLARPGAFEDLIHICGGAS
jgi:hypothetical protein